MPTETQWGHRRHSRVRAVPFRGTQDALPTDLSHLLFLGHSVHEFRIKAQTLLCKLWDRC